MYAYTRTPDPAQLEATTAAFKAAGADLIFADNKPRSAILTPQLDEMLALSEAGTVILIDSLKSFGADLRDVFIIIEQIRQRGAHLVILDSELDTRVNDSFFKTASAFSAVIPREADKPMRTAAKANPILGTTVSRSAAHLS